MCKLKLVLVRRGRGGFLFLLINLLVLSKFSVRSQEKDELPTPEVVKELQDLALKQIKEAWDITLNISKTDANSPVVSISEYWKNTKIALQIIHDEIKRYDRRILSSRPSSLMNKVLDLQDLTNLQILSDTITDNPTIKWRVKWIELSSMATHIHRLYNKRLRDVFNDEPYVKTVAQSVYKYSGYLWYSRLSGNEDKTHSFLMQNFPAWIDERIESVPEGDLFFGLRQLIDDNPTAKASSTIESGDCKGAQTIGRIVPSSLEGPIYVLIYLALVDIKFFILMNFYYIYSLVYEDKPYSQQEQLMNDMSARLKKKADMYKEAFKDFGKAIENKPMPAPVEPGYFRCDPAQQMPDNPMRSHVYKFTYIKITNFLKVFVAPERDFRASKSCEGSCDMIDGTRAPCNETDLACIQEFEDDCIKNPILCEGFKPPCPIEDTVCMDSAMEVSVCPSKKKDRALEWAKINNKTHGDQSGECSQAIVTHRGEWVMEKETIVDTPTMCEVCMCHCYAPIGNDQSTVRSFSLKAALSLFNKTQNKHRAVVGVKFEQVKDQIHLMIAEAEVKPNYEVDMKTLTWRKPPVVTNSSFLTTLRRNLRIIHLDDLVAPPGYVVTGVRFIESSYEGVYLHEYVGIQIQVRLYDAFSGRFIPDDKGKYSVQWIGNNNATISREPYNYVDPDDPVKADGPALPDSSSNQFLSFRATSISKDLGQNTIPYFDAQRVILDNENSKALRGIGLFHKARPRYGGFLGLKIMKYNDSPSS